MIPAHRTYAFGAEMGRYFDADSVEYLTSETNDNSPLAVTRVSSRKFEQRSSRSLATEDACILIMTLKDWNIQELRNGGKIISDLNHPAFSFCAGNLQEEQAVELYEPFDMLQIYLPNSSFESIDVDVKGPEVRVLRSLREPVHDPILKRLMTCLLDPLAEQDPASKLFVDHVLHAIQAYLVHKFSDKVPRTIRKSRWVLAPWQQRRAIDLMSSRFAESITLASLAKECQLSVNHFARAFKGSVGETPHHWLLKRRMEHASHLLQRSSMDATEIALACGFSHRVAFSRAFQRVMGITPGRWRQLHRKLPTMVELA